MPSKRGIWLAVGEILLPGKLANGGHKGLVAVVAGPEVAVLKGAGHGQLGHFLAIAEDAKLGFAHEYFLAASQRSVAAFPGQAVIGKKIGLGEGRGLRGHNGFGSGHKNELRAGWEF